MKIKSFVIDWMNKEQIMENLFNTMPNNEYSISNKVPRDK